MTNLQNELITRHELSHRESEVAEAVTKGLSNKEVADKLFVSEKTVKFHLTNIYKKMRIRSRSQLIVTCIPTMTVTETSPTEASANTGSVLHQGVGNA